MSLSVCLLTRNEETNIARALRSVAGLADEVIVADTASRDRTASIAAELGAKVLQFPWEDDFAAGRNFVVGQAAGDWLLWLHGSEELLPESWIHVRAAMQRPLVFAYFVQIQNGAPEGRHVEFSATSDIRLFRRRPDLRFVGRLHPHYDSLALEAIRLERQQIAPSAITLRATPSPEEASEAKLRWTLRLLELELADRPGQLHYQIEHGRTLLLLQDPHGHEVLAQAAEQVLAAREAAVPPSFKVQVLFDYLLTAKPEHIRVRLTRDEVANLAVRWFPNSPPLLSHCAHHFFKAGEYRRSADLLERLLFLGKTGTSDRSRRFDRALTGPNALLNLAACHQQLGEFDKAEKYYRDLLSIQPTSVQALQGLTAIAQLRRAT